jgi:hypothetical protein
MESVLAALVILIVASISFSIFIIYFVFKVLQFVVLAVNLYKKMVNRQDATIKLLLDIRDNNKQYKNLSSVSEEIENTLDIRDTFMCEDCKAAVPSNAKLCPNCGAEFE